jgi:hypothetical protein
MCVRYAENSMLLAIRRYGFSPGALQQSPDSYNPLKEGQFHAGGGDKATGMQNSKDPFVPILN